jgi:hypothetical protein
MVVMLSLTDATLILIATPDSLVAGFFQRLPICEASFPLYAEEFRLEKLLP